MKRGFIIGVIALLVLLLFAFINPGRDKQERLPAYPQTVNEPGEYWIDAMRSVVIFKSVGDEVFYSETSISDKEEKEGAIQVTHSYKRKGMRLPDGYAIGFEAPDTIVIEMGNGLLIRRKHGDVRQDLRMDEKPKGKVLKNPSDPSSALPSEAKVIPASEVDVLTPPEE